MNELDNAQIDERRVAASMTVTLTSNSSDIEQKSDLSEPFYEAAAKACQDYGLAPMDKVFVSVISGDEKHRISMTGSPPCLAAELYVEQQRNKLRGR